MKIKNILYVLLCLLGGCMIGLNAGKLNNVANPYSSEELYSGVKLRFSLRKLPNSRLSAISNL